MEDEIVRLRRDGWTVNEITEKGLVCRQTVMRILREHGLYPEPKRQRGLTHCRRGHERRPNEASCTKCARERLRRYNRLRKYGLDDAGYQQLLDEQSGKCAICEVVPDYQLRVDHDHETGHVRGLLCTNCNVALGKFKDNVEGLRKALRYVQKCGCC